MLDSNTENMTDFLRKKIRSVNSERKSLLETGEMPSELIEIGNFLLDLINTLLDLSEKAENIKLHIIARSLLILGETISDSKEDTVELVKAMVDCRLKTVIPKMIKMMDGGGQDLPEEACTLNLLDENGRRISLEEILKE